MNAKLLLPWAFLLAVFSACSDADPPREDGTVEDLLTAGASLRATLTGAAVPNGGDLSGSGTADLALNLGQRLLCFDLVTAGIGQPTTAHVHAGGPGITGAALVDLDLAANGPAGCVEAERKILLAILHAPEGHYVDVHTSDFPDGAIRGQLAITHKDATAPWLNALSFTPSIADVSLGAAQLTFTVEAIDDLSGIESLAVTATAPSQATSATCSVQPPIKTYPLTLTGSCAVTIPQSSEVGSWNVSVSLTDRAGNQRDLSADALQDMGLTAAFEVFQDHAGPSLTSLAVAPPHVYVYSSAAQLTASIAATDDSSGIASATVTLTSPSAASSAACELLPPPDTYPLAFNDTCALTLPQASEGGTWAIAVTLQDRVGNITALGPTELASSGYASTIEVTAVPVCTDGVKNGTESDVDCGGTCEDCADGFGCTENADCQSNSCDAGNNACLSSTCNDGVVNNDQLGETDVDCGGTCGPCVNTQVCSVASDCTSGYCDPNMVCAACTAGTDCAAGSYCSAGVCTPDPLLGTACTTADQCPSGYCVEGVCCNSDCTAPCMSCSIAGSLGTCAALASGQQDNVPANSCVGYTFMDAVSCDGAGNCKPANGRPCANPVDCASGHCSPEGFCCNESCDQTCKECNQHTFGVCRNLYKGMQDFAAPVTCTGADLCDGSGHCVKPIGTACTSGAECFSGHCTDGVCCDSACTTCQDCNSLGHCQLVPDYTSDDDSCSGGWVCAHGYCGMPNGSPCPTGNGSLCVSGKCPYGVCVP